MCKSSVYFSAPLFLGVVSLTSFALETALELYFSESYAI